MPPNGKIKLRVTSKTKRKLVKKKGRSKALKVFFYFDGSRKRDKKPAFKAKYFIGAPPSGSKHKLKAKVFLKRLKDGKRFKKTIKASFRVC